MPLVPIRHLGKTRIVWTPDSLTGENALRLEEESQRRLDVTTRRRYADGRQYDDANWREAEDCLTDPAKEKLPEHRRLHAYSTQIGESVTFLADQLSDGLQILPAATEVEVLVNQLIMSNERLMDEEGQPAFDDVLLDALTASDVAYYLSWDIVNDEPRIEFWESEAVYFEMDKIDQPPTKVQRDQIIWTVDQDGRDIQVFEHVVYHLLVNPFGVLECVADTYWDNDDTPRDRQWLGIPFIPWGLLRPDRRGLRQFRGESVITTQAMDSADRYNAVEQQGYRIARQNSHSNVVITGDAAFAQIEGQGRVVRKDVADALVFPGANNVHALTLPTDDTMIKHQREVTANAIYATFGLARVEPDTLQGLGGITGYALEILNRKSEGTFRRIRRQFVKDLKSLINLMLDMAAYKKRGLVEREPLALELQGITMLTFDETVDPKLEYLNRDVEIRMGTGYIVDDVMIRDDFTAKLISRKTALKKRGEDDDAILDIEREMAEEAPAEATTFQVGSPNGTQAGSTIGSTARQ